VGIISTIIAETGAKILVNELSDIITSLGVFSITKIKDQFARTISFTVGATYRDQWMEEALYALLYQYNTIRNKSNLSIVTYGGTNDKSVYYRLSDGLHTLRYRQYPILLLITSTSSNKDQPTGRGSVVQRTYSVSTFDLSENFVTQFERDMLRHRNDLLRIKSDLDTINVYRDSHDQDGYTYWEKAPSIAKRYLRTVYLPAEIKLTLVNTVNRFFSDKEYYRKHGIPHNLKILLSAPTASGKESLSKAIASEWIRNLYFVTGGKKGRFVPHAITSNNVTNPLFLISDIDRYPFLINDELPVAEGTTEDKLEENKLSFVQMINALDGVMSGEDRIIVMTTNHIEKFSPTFLRPGRIDLLLEFNRVVPEVFRRFIYDYYGKVIPENIKLVRDDISVPELQADAHFLKLPVEEILRKYTK